MNKAQKIVDTSVLQDLRSEIDELLTVAGQTLPVAAIGLQLNCELSGKIANDSGLCLYFPVEEGDPSAIYASPDSYPKTGAACYECMIEHVGQLKLWQQQLTTELSTKQIEQLATDVSHLVVRHINRHQLAVFREDIPVWSGCSHALRQTESLIQRYAGVDFPVLLKGDTGCGKLLAAYHVHCLSGRKQQPFVEVCCLQWAEQDCLAAMEDYLQQADQGTLFLRNLNVLSADMLMRLKHHWEREYITRSVPVRIIASLSPRYPDHALTSSSAPWLELQLPDLIRRKHDIPALTTMLLQKYRCIKPLALSQASVQALMEHSWDDNVKGLEHCIALLAVMAEQENIEFEYLHSLFPDIARPAVEGTTITTGLLKDNELLEPDDAEQSERGILDTICLKGLAQKIIQQQVEQLDIEHPALKKSLQILSQHYQSKLTLDQLATMSFVSGAHLSALYRKHLGFSFKQLLLHVRVEKLSNYWS